MLNGIVNALTNPVLLNVSQNTTAQVSIETGLKAVGRPAFTLMDKHADEKTKNYSAVKEFVYQGLCLLIYMTLIIPLFKKGGFSLFKKVFKNERSFNNFANADEFLNYHKLACMKRSERINHKLMEKIPDKTISLPNNRKSTMRHELLYNEKPLKYPMAKGCIERCSLVGSVLGLTILAPELSHLFLHPIMHLMGFKEAQTPKTNNENEAQNINLKA